MSYSPWGGGGRDINSLNLLVIIEYFPLSRALGYCFKSSSGSTLAVVLTVMELSKLAQFLLYAQIGLTVFCIHAISCELKSVRLGKILSEI